MYIAIFFVFFVFFVVKKLLSEILVQICLEAVFVLFADWDESIVVEYDAGALNDVYLVEVDDVGTVYAHKLLLGQVVFHRLDCKEAHNRAAAINVKPHVLAH